MSDTPALPTTQEIEALVLEHAHRGLPLKPDADFHRRTFRALRQQRDRIAALEAALRECANQFQFYADEHTRAGKDEKAATNQRFADLARKALGHE